MGWIEKTWWNLTVHWLSRNQLITARTESGKCASPLSNTFSGKMRTHGSTCLSRRARQGLACCIFSDVICAYGLLILYFKAIVGMFPWLNMSA